MQGGPFSANPMRFVRQRMNAARVDPAIVEVDTRARLTALLKGVASVTMSYAVAGPIQAFHERAQNRTPNHQS